MAKVQYKLMKCHHCGALYRPQKWYYGTYVGTSSDFTLIGTISEKHCPVCLRPNNTTEGGYNNEMQFL